MKENRADSQSTHSHVTHNPRTHVSPHSPGALFQTTGSLRAGAGYPLHPSHFHKLWLRALSLSHLRSTEVANNLIPICRI